MMDARYITHRFINACLRENVYTLLSHSTLIDTTRLKLTNVPDKLNVPDNLKDHSLWLKISTSQSTNWLPVVDSDYMQQWQLLEPTWIQETSNSYQIKDHYQDFIEVLKQLPESSKDALNDYLIELDCAAEHRSLARKAFERHQQYLNKDIKACRSWSERLLYADQVASYLDHPYYPTARAKLGLTSSDIESYSPEFAPNFELNWVAVPKSRATIRAQHDIPDIWPSFKAVGLDASLQHSHYLFPVHPLTVSLIKDKNSTALPTEEIMFAPKTALEVQPTLSVRTVACLDDPSIHIKVPLIARTLGNKNIRLIKPSTLYDGFWFQQTLQLIEQNDEDLNGCFYHCDEAIGGHVGDDKALAFIVRRYDADKLSNKTPVPVAALGSVMPDGRPFVAHLIDQYYKGNAQKWLTEYVQLLCHVHLTLWLKYGIALESNQQNAVILFEQQTPQTLDTHRMTLLMKDNDAARILPSRFEEGIRQANLINKIDIHSIKDKRILVADELALAQMFLTITLQLDIAAIIEMMHEHQLINRSEAYSLLTSIIESQLHRLENQGYSIELAQKLLLEDSIWYIKYLLCSGSLLSKEQSGAADINKFYGHSAPNTLARIRLSTYST